MSRRKQPSTILEPVIDRLVDGLQPERIYLFGSQASGQASQDSDFDLMVIVPESALPRHRREAISYDLLWGLTTPVDLIVLTREEFNRTSQVKTSLAAQVKAHGQVLYYGDLPSMMVSKNCERHQRL